MAACLLAMAAGTPAIGLTPAGASPGALDPTFGTKGHIEVPVGSESSYIQRLARQADGKLVVFGGWGLKYYGAQWMVMRVTADGHPDETFAQHGVFVAGRGGASRVYGGVGLIQADGKIVALGYELGGSADVLRLGIDGTPDPGFGSQGTMSIPTPSTGFGAELVQQADGKLLISGASFGQPAMFRVNSNGTPDTSYGSQSIAVLAPNTNATIYTMRLQADGTALVAWVENTTVVIHRVTTTGSLDPSFGTNGSVTVTFPSNVQSIGPKLLADGGLLVETTPTVTPGTGAPQSLSRFDAAGQPVTTFGSNGTLDLRAVTLTNNVHAEPQPDGSILIVGAGATNGTTQRMYVERRTATGALDLAFGCLGRASGGPGTDPAVGTVVNPDGSLVVVSTVANRIIPVPGGPPDVVYDPQLLRYANPSPNGACGFIVDGYGGLHAYGMGGMALPPVASGGPYWRGWDIVRGLAVSGTVGGLVLDGWGVLHPIDIDGHVSARVTGGAYWPGRDIARGVALLPSGTGGYVLDGLGGLHPFGVGNNQPPPAVTNAPYWPAWDIARGVALLPNGTGGYVLDGLGGLHPFGIGNNQPPPAVTNAPYWANWNIARGVALTADGSGGYVEDGWGELHAFSIGNHAVPSITESGGASWQGWDIARGMTIVS
jgi:uncharacterized delta-60 repeat protein